MLIDRAQRTEKRRKSQLGIHDVFWSADDLVKTSLFNFHGGCAKINGATDTGEVTT